MLATLLVTPDLLTDQNGVAIGGEALAEIGALAERAGFHGIAITDHPFPPAEMAASTGLDPIVALSFVAAATTRLRLRTHIYVLPYRNPFLAAKSFATLDALSGGRLEVGVAAGYVEGEFEALGYSFAERNEALDQAIGAMKAAWTGSPVDMSGTGWSASGNVLYPVPAQRPHPPIWLGGNAERAIRRAVDQADGWAPTPQSSAGSSRKRTSEISTFRDLERRISYCYSYADAVGRATPVKIIFFLGGYPASQDPDCILVEEATQVNAKRLADLGVTELGVRVRSNSISDFAATISRLGDELLGALAAIGQGG
jgi:probable F420-dependent oxidoreductase